MSNFINTEALEGIIIAFKIKFKAAPTIFGYIKPDNFDRVEQVLDGHGLTGFEIKPKYYCSPLYTENGQLKAGHSISEEVDPFVLSEGDDFWYGVDKNGNVVYFTTLESQAKWRDGSNINLSKWMR